ncbi:hypothetical protein [Hansschlegelia sp. KR7-227]|uniref:hypothetical protein n=1 Tax=Hansschlegelia sp. KR7-227 TaxID=3400914 RepID=UPI003C084252
MGQSNNAGITSPQEPYAITKVPPLPGVVLCPNGGTVPHQYFPIVRSVDVPIDPTRYETFVDAAEALPSSVIRGESVCTPAAVAFAGPHGLKGRGQVIVFSVAIGSSTFEQLVGSDEDKQPFVNAVNILMKARNFASKEGKTLKIAGVLWSEGETSQNLRISRAEVRSQLQTLRKKVDSLGMEVGQMPSQERVPIVIAQLSKAAHHSGIGAVAFEQERACREVPGMFLVPTYWADAPDGAGYHYSSKGQMQLGAALGLKLADYWNGANCTHLYPYYVRREGETVTSYWTANVTSDVSKVFDPGSFGISYEDSTGRIEIERVTIEGSTVTISLSRIPTGRREQLQIGHFGSVKFEGEEGFGIGPVSGLRSNIRTVKGRRSVPGGPLVYDWAAQKHSIEVDVIGAPAEQPTASEAAAAPAADSRTRRWLSSIRQKLGRN